MFIEIRYSSPQWGEIWVIGLPILGKPSAYKAAVYKYPGVFKPLIHEWKRYYSVGSGKVWSLTSFRQTGEGKWKNDIP
ncbi:hypothetical protein EL17_09415 [Anditalea andensis]|uniref:Uncharacterized protein n=1 Tax=Anditalea andensis TaxID=1048983 RepID=A0A074KVC8_9BACT|nr:hypothetical protein EL17_09415 [Anditalea andensis]